MLFARYKHSPHDRQIKLDAKTARLTEITFGKYVQVFNVFVWCVYKLPSMVLIIQGKKIGFLVDSGAIIWV